MKRIVTIMAVCCAGFSSGAMADEAAAVLPESCEITQSGEIIVLVHCAQPLADEQLAQTGRAACKDKQLCGAWIWKQREDMPETAPDNHDGLTQAQVTSATAVWSQETQQLISISKSN